MVETARPWTIPGLRPDLVRVAIERAHVEVVALRLARRFPQRVVDAATPEMIREVERADG